MTSMLDWLLCALVKFVSGLLCLVPPPAAVWLGERLGEAAMRLQPKRTRIGLLNLRAAFDPTLGVIPSERSESRDDGALSPSTRAGGPRSGFRPTGLEEGAANAPVGLHPAEARRIIRGCYRQLGASFVELLRLPVIDRAYIERYVAIEGRAHFEEAVASGRPVILLTGHYGNWELSSITAALMGSPITALARAQDKFPRLYRLLVSFRESKGCRIIHKGGAMKRLIAALDARQLVGIVGDQASRQGIFVDFFGRPALFATGPFKLAYAKEALVLPAFIRRVRGPYHRVLLDPPLRLPRTVPKEEAVRTGAERFAGVLARRIREEPGQWLWMHKRWKHTTARRLLVLSDGKAGHLKQSLAVVDALRERHPGLAHAVVDIRYRSVLARLAALLWSWGTGSAIGATRCLEWTLSPESRSALLGRYADAIVSCGASLAPVNLLWARENLAKSIVIMTPAPLPLGRFDLVIAPRHDALPRRPNVVPVTGALAARMREEVPDAAARLRAHPRFRPATEPGEPVHRHPVVAVFLGGDTPHHELSVPFAEALLTQVQDACEAVDGWCLVTTSRRTSAAVEQRLAEQLGSDPRCRLLLLASRDALDGTMEGMLGSADAAVVTGESTSMVSEACTSGRRVLVVELPLRRPGRGLGGKHERFLRELEEGGYITRVAVPDACRMIRRALTDRTPPKRLDNLADVREALGRLL
jgi:KDO2-lipid IV(A) lauroyltransferase